MEQYLKHFEPDEPRDEFEDKNQLHSVQINSCAVIIHLEQTLELN